MGRIQKVQRSFAIKAPMAQMFDIWTTKLPLMSTFCPDQINSVDLVQGVWGNQGCVIQWDFNLQGKSAITKDIMEVIDEENNIIVYKVLEGGPLEDYKSFSWIFQAFPKKNVVRWILEYEKDDEFDPEPTLYLDLVVVMMNEIDAHLTQQ